MHIQKGDTLAHTLTHSNREKSHRWMFTMQNTIKSMRKFASVGKKLLENEIGEVVGGRKWWLVLVVG